MIFNVSFLLLCLHGSHIFATPIGDHGSHDREHTHMDHGVQQNHLKFDNQTTPLPAVKNVMKDCMCDKSKMDSTFSNIADSFLEKIQQKSFPNEIIEDLVTNGLESVRQSIKTEHKPKLMKYERCFIMVAGGVITIVLAFSIIYSCYAWCCCCCQESDQQNDVEKLSSSKNVSIAWEGYTNPFVRHALNFLLLVFIIAILCCCIGSVMSLMQFNRAAEKLTSVVGTTFDDVGVYLKNTCKKLEDLLVKNFEQFKREFLAGLDNTFGEIGSEAILKRSSKSLDNLSNLIANEEILYDNLEKMQNDLFVMESNLTNLKNELIKNYENLTIKVDCQNITTNLDKCSMTKKIGDYLQSLEHYKLINTFKIVNKDLTMINSKMDIFDNAKGSLMEKFDRLKTKVVGNSSEDKKSIDKEFFKVGRYLSIFADSTTDRLVTKNNMDKHKAHIGKYEPRLKKYVKSMWLTFMFIVAIVVVIIGLVALGFLLSCCGKSPGYKTKQFCVSSNSICLFSTSIVFSIISMVIIGLVASVMFLVVGNASVFLCTEWVGPRKDVAVLPKIAQQYWLKYRPVIGMRMNKYMNGNRSLEGEFLDGLNMDSIVKGCVDGKTLFTIFNIAGRVDFTDIDSFRMRMAEGSNKIVKTIDSITIDDLKFIDSFLNQLSTIANERKYIIWQLINKIDSVVELVGTVFNTTEWESLKSLAEKITDTNEQQLLVSFVQQMKDLIKSQTFDNDLQLNNLKAILKEANSTALLPSATLMIETIVESLKQKINQTAQHSMFLVDNYVESVLKSLENDVTSCKEMPEIVKKISRPLCEGIIGNINGFSLAMMICVLLLIPTVLIVTMLKRMYANALKLFNDGNSNQKLIVNAYSTLTDEIELQKSSEALYNHPSIHNSQAERLQYQPITEKL